MRLTKKELYRAALSKWGESAQMLMLFEEVGELLQAIGKFERQRCEAIDVCGEIADVEIMLEQYCEMTGGLEPMRTVIELRKQEKLERLESRVLTTPKGGA